MLEKSQNFGFIIESVLVVPKADFGNEAMRAGGGQEREEVVFLFYSQESKSREERGLPTARGSSAGNAAAMCDPGVVSAAVTAPGLISYHTCLRPRRAMPI